MIHIEPSAQYLPLFVTGVARGGTTLLTKILDAHPSIGCASDPYFPLFLSLHNQIRSRLASKSVVTGTSTIQDYYFSGEGGDLLRAIQDSSAEVPVPQNEIGDLLGRIRDRMKHESPDLECAFKLFEGDTYLDCIGRAFEVIAKHRGSPPPQVVGFKEVWCVEFCSLLKRHFPNLKVIILFRDPRAVVNSNLRIAQSEPDAAGHLLSYARHWRKQLAFSLKYAMNPLLQEDILLLKYEDLVTDSDATARKICEFLGVQFQSEMLDPENFRDYSTHSTWTGNSSYKESNNGISLESVERWREHLPVPIQKLIELCCFYEMKYLGYEPDYEISDLIAPEVYEYISGSHTKYTNWRSDQMDPVLDYSYEVTRALTLSSRGDKIEDEDFVRRFFLFDRAYDVLQRVGDDG